MKKLISVLIFVLVFISMFSSVYTAEGMAPYENYVYSVGDGELTVAPQAYLDEKIIYGRDLGISEFNNASDVFYDKKGNLFILDTGNNRIVVLNVELKLEKIIDCKFILENGNVSTLNEAKGLYVDKSGIYIADTKNARIIVLDYESGELKRIINSPKSNVLDKDFLFKPIRLTVDKDGLLYVVSEGTYEGILNFTAQGEFIGFFGVNNVTSSAWDLFWRRFSTKEQRKNMVQLVPRDFSSIDLDQNGFFMATTYTAENNSMIKRLNPGGIDIIRSSSSVGLMGDPQAVWSGTLEGNSSFIDIASGPDNIYACLDITRGKIFCYDNDGYMLYTFGTLADRDGGFTKPCAITYIEDKIAVLDNARGCITCFAPTDYANTLNTAIHYQRLLQYDTAAEYWNKVLDLNSNCDLALNKFGQACYNSGEYRQAAEYFRKVNNKEMYSKAMQEIRAQFLYDNIYIIVVAIIALYFIFKVISILKKSRGRKRIK